MQITVYDNGQQTGPFPIETVHQMIRAGSLSASAVVWYEGAPDWIPLPAFLQQHPMSMPAAGAGIGAGPRMGAQAIPAASSRMMAQPSSSGSELSDTSRLIRATIAGGVAALIGGGVWAGLAIGVGIQLGWVAWGIGLLCGFAVSKLGKGHGTIFQVMAAVFSLVGIGIGKFGFVMAVGEGLSIVDTFRVRDIIFVVLAVISAWRMAGGNE